MFQEVNQKTIDGLLKYMSKADYVALFKDFEIETTQQLNQINIEAALEDIEKVIRAVHSIRGNAISLGFDRLSEESATLEALLKADKNIKKSTIFDTYKSQVKDQLNYITNYLMNDDRLRL